jgi:hypothetical protein
LAIGARLDPLVRRKGYRVNKPQYYLEAEDESPDKVFTFPLDDWPCTVGRSSGCQLQLDFDRISRHHAQFEQVDNGLRVTDLKSTNGTFVNHSRIEGPTEVHDGDSIHFADHAFFLRFRDPSGLTRSHPEARKSRGGTDTVIGFTAAPTGFPVQAPEFFETLNDELVCATRQIMVSGRGTVLANALRGRSTHPQLGVDSATLTRLSEELGEELRLTQLIRRIALQQADQANLHTDLFLAIHPSECEEPEVLIQDLKLQCQRFRHLTLVCELPFDMFETGPRAGNMASRLKQLGVEICATGLTADDEPANVQDTIDYVRFSARNDPDSIERLIERYQEFVNVLVDDLEDRAMIERFSQAGATLFRGPAIGPERDIST